MEISGVSSGVFATTAQNNGDTATTQKVVRNTLATESQTQTQTNDAVSQATKSGEYKLETEGNVGTRFKASA